MRRLTVPSIGILLWVLHVAPFVHVHTGRGNHGISEEVLVHSHPPVSETTRTETGSVIDDEHTAESIDPFASVATKPLPVSVTVEVLRDAPPVTSRRQLVRSQHDWQERGPPRVGPPLRAPPA